MKQWKLVFAPRLIVMAILMFHGIFLFQNCSSSGMQVQYLEESSVSQQGVAEVKFDLQKVAFGPGTSELNFTVEKTASQKIKAYSCQWNLAANFDCSSRKLQITSLKDGDHKLKVKVVYDSGQSEEAFTNIRVDRSQPTLSYLQTPVPVSNLTSGVVQFAAQDSVSGLQSVTCSLDNATAMNCSSSSFLFNNLAAGPHSLKIILKDFAGNSLEKVFLWTIDTVQPSVSISEAPAANSNLPNVQFSFSGVNQNSFECSLDGAAYTPCSSPKQLLGLTNGAHSFRVRALRNNGNVSEPAERSWMTDSSVPTLSFSKTPSASTNQKTAQFMFTSTATGQFYCSLDASVFEACSSPKDYSGLAAGDHVFKVKIKNNFGTESVVGSASTFSWTIDLSVPTVIINQSPGSITRLAEAIFAFAGTGILNYQCRLDAGNFESCSSPKKYSGLMEGTHRFQVKGVNAVDTESSVAEYSWNIETTLPVMKILSQPAAVSSVSVVSFAFGVTNSQMGIQKYECAIDSGTLAACVSPFTSQKLSDGSHVFKVRAVSAAGNTSELALVNFEIDSVVPVLTVSAQPALFSRNDFETISFTSQAVSANFRCQINQDLEAACTSPLRVDYKNDRAMSVFIRAVSRSGVESVTKTVTWEFDKTAPSVPAISADVMANTQKTGANLSFNSVDANGIDHFECSLDGAPASKCSSPFNLKNLLEGNHEFKVMSFDKAQNPSTAGTFSWFVDKTGPQITVTSKPEAVSDKAIEVVQWSISDNSGSPVIVTCSFDGVVTSTNCLSPASFSIGAVGAHQIILKATDVAGNSSQTTIDWSSSISLSGYTEYPTIRAIPGTPAMNIFDSAPQIFKSEDQSSIYVSSSCGVMESQDGGVNFLPKKLNLPEAPLAMAVANGRMFVGTVTGVYVSLDDGATFHKTFDGEIAQKIYQKQAAQALPCSASPSFGKIDTVLRLGASGTTVVISTGNAIYVSNDSGETFNLPTMMSGDYILPELIAGDIQFGGADGKEIYLAIRASKSDSITTKKKNGICGTNSDVPAFGLMRSNDGGKTFTAIDSGVILGFAFLKSRVNSNLAFAMATNNVSDLRTAGFIRSIDSGGKFSKSVESSIKSAPIATMGMPNQIAESGTGFLHVIQQTSDGTKVFRSEDQGKTFSESVMKSARVNQPVAQYGLVESGGRILVSTNQGLWTSNDDGKTFSLSKKYSSGYCAAPWWRNLRAFASSLESIYVTNATGNFVSKDSGKTFSVMDRKGLDTNILELYATGVSTVYAYGQTNGLYASNDSGANFSGPFQSIKDSQTQETLFYQDSTYSGASGSFPSFYISSDGTDQRMQLKKMISENPSYRLQSALSIGKRIIAAIYPLGVVTFDNGVKIYGNSEIATSLQNNFIRVRRINGVIYLLGNEVWSSHDTGKTFQKVATAPKFGVDIALISGKVSIPDVTNYLWMSPDNGVSFDYLRGDLK